MQKKIVFITNEFPYKTGENFIAPEGTLLPDGYDVEIVPLRKHKATDVKRKVKEGVQVKDIFASPSLLTKIRATIFPLFNREFYEELYLMKKRGYLTFDSIRRAYGYFVRARNAYYILEKEYKKELKKNTIVLYSYWLMYASLACAWLKKRYGCSIYSRAHGVDVWDNANIYKVTPGRSFVIRQINKLFVCSKQGAEYLQEKYPKQKDHITYSYLGSEDMGLGKHKDADDPCRIVTCARMVPLKRIHLLADALKKIDNLNIEWVHFGDGPEMDNVKDHCKDLPENISVKFMGNTPHDKVMEYYKTHYVDVFVNTSNTEGVPVSIMEAISFGIPAIATDVGGTKEIVTSESGTLIPVDFTDEMLSEEIVKCLTRDEHIKMRDRALTRNFWEKHFSAKNNYEEFYKCLK